VGVLGGVSKIGYVHVSVLGMYSSRSFNITVEKMTRDRDRVRRDRQDRYTWKLERTELIVCASRLSLNMLSGVRSYTQSSYTRRLR
jgi:hypothetical protein